jgi:hypothetical protein
VLPLEDHPTTRLQRLAASHPSSRTRIARIDAYVRRLN